MLLVPPSPSMKAGGIFKGGRLRLRVGQLWSANVDFVGKGKPYFDAPPPTTQRGRDYAVSTTLSVRWHRLDFIGRHPLLGLLEVRLAGPHHSQGIIRSLAAAWRSRASAAHFAAWTSRLIA